MGTDKTCLTVIRDLKIFFNKQAYDFFIDICVIIVIRDNSVNLISLEYFNANSNNSQWQWIALDKDADRVELETVIKEKT